MTPAPNPSIESLEKRFLLSGGFLPQQTFAVAPHPLGLAVADINNDGHPDLIVGSYTNNSISILLGTGSGSFQPQQSFAAALAGLQNIAVADFNGDGRPDLALSYLLGKGVGIRLGNGNGTFQAQQTIAAGYRPTGIVAADLDGDGHPDLVLSDQVFPYITILLSNANGTFKAPQSLAATNSYSLAVADLNGDNHADIVNSGFQTRLGAVLLGNGNGTFQAQPTLATGYTALTVAVADLNGDSKPDLIFGDYADATAVRVFLGNGNGTFQAPQTFAPGYRTFSLQAGDVNGDGRNDVVMAEYLVAGGSGRAAILLGNGNGTLQTQITYATGIGPRELALTDVNGDGRPDIVTVNAVSNTVSVLLNNYGGSSPTITQSGGMVTGSGSSSADAGSVIISGSFLIITIGSVSDTIPLSSITGIVLDPGGGDDSIHIGTGVPPVTVGAAGGNDTITAGNSGDLLRGGRGTDLITAGKNGTNDTVIGGGGNDTLVANGASQQLFGGPNSDVFVNATGFGDSIDGGIGLNFAQSNSADTLANIFEIYDPNPLAPPTATPAVASDTLSGVLQIFGTTGSDSLLLTDNGLGELLINGANPIPEAGLTGILLAGGEGDDTLAVDPSVKLTVTLRGAKGNDSLSGGGGDNVLVGGAGNDTLRGGAGTNDLAPGRRVTFVNAPSGSDSLIGGPTGSRNYADFAYRTDNLFLSNDGKPDSGDLAMGETTTIMPSVQNIFAGAAQDTIVSTTPAGFLSAGVGHDSLTSGGANTILVAGPPGAGSDTIAANGAANGLFLLNGQADIYSDTVPSDILQTDAGLDASQ